MKDSTGKVWVVYTNLTSPYDPSTSDVWYVTTSNKGSTWSEPRQVTSFPGEEGDPSIVELEEAFYVFYNDRYNPDIWYVTSEDGGITWSSTPERIDSDSAQEGSQNAAIIGANAWVVYVSDRSGNWDIWLSRTMRAKLSATINIDPDTLNLKSKGKWITGYVELPEGYDVADINVSTVRLNDTIPVDLSAPTDIGDYDNDTIPDLMVKFNRTEVADFIISKGIVVGNVTLTITGKLYDGTFFEGSDVIRVRMPGDINCDGMVDGSDLIEAARAFASYPTHKRWNSIADENEDNVIDGSDLVQVARNFGKTYL